MTVRSTYSAHKRLVVGAVVLVVAATGLTGLATSALFTDTAAVTAGSFATGTVSLFGSYASGTLSLANMAPGDVVTKAMNVTNDGSLPLRYSLTSVTTGDAPLAAALVMNVKTGVSTCDNTGFGLTGTAVAGPTVFGSAGGTPIIGTVAPGGGNGEVTVPAMSGMTLCFQVALPTSWTTQSVSASTTFTFNAEQTANN